ncbi:hypothetical protein OF83DRAFT_1283342 [Amylostereum chailletii]|nr:hypothetical protein OF83DRAFT_1283342 [Amylostereum chailletii]
MRRSTLEQRSTRVSQARISLLNHHLASSFPHLTSQESAHSQLVHALSADPLRTPTHGNKVGFLDTSVGPATLVLYYQLAHYASSLRISTSTPPFSQRECAWCARLLSDAVTVAQQDVDGAAEEDGCEVLYGRAGLLYALLLLRQSLPQASSSSSSSGTPNGLDELKALVWPLTHSSTLKTLVDDIIRRGTAGAAQFAQETKVGDGPGLMWTWHGKRYLGGAHGAAGILDVILHAPSHIVAPHKYVITQTLTYMLFLQDDHGNWPTHASVLLHHHPSPPPSDLVQWCHGASGVIPLLATALSLPSLSLSSDLRSALQHAIARAGTLVYAHGLLRKGGGLCHGVAGSACALFALADCGALPPAARQRYLWHGLHLVQCYVELAPRNAFNTPDRPWSLYEGSAGMCSVLAWLLGRMDAMRGEHSARVPLRSAFLGCADLMVGS